MEAAFVKILTIFLTLGTVGVEPNPNAPGQAEVLAYAPPRADAMAFVDFGAFVPNNYKALVSLPSHPELRRDARARQALTQLVQMVETGRKMVQGMSGVDLTTDLSWAAAWIDVPSAGDPRVLLVVKGKLPADLLDRVGAAIGQSPRKLGAGVVLSEPGGHEVVGMTRDGVLLAGSKKLVEPRLRANWRSRVKFNRLPKLWSNKPFLVVASSPSRAAIRRYSRELDDPEAAVAKDFVTGHKFAALALTHDGLEWSWVSRSRSGHERAVQASEGVIELMRATHLGSRGFTKLALAVMKSYAGQFAEIKAALKHEKLILQVVQAATGDGNFKVAVDDKRSQRSLHVRATGKELSDVLPMAGLLPALGGAAAWFGASQSGPSHMTMPPARTTAP